MFIEVAEIKALELMAEHGLVQNGWTLRFRKGSSFLGRCWTTQKIIDLSIPYIENNDWEPMIRDTVLHEICHAFAPPFWKNGQWKYHHPQWRRKCVELGCTPERASKKPVLPPKKAPKYIANCSCGEKHEIRAKGKHFTHYVCKICRAKLVFSENPVYSFA